MMLVNNFISFLKSIYFFFKYRPKVCSVVWENSEVFSVYISGQNLDQLNIKAGQYLKFRFFKKGIYYREYPLSLSSLPRGGVFRITIKNVSPFTDKISKLRVGQNVFFRGPFGGEIKKESEGKFLIVAGGVAVSVARVVFEDLVKKNNDVCLICSVSKSSDILFKKEFDELVDKYGGKVIYYFSQKEGRLNREKIANLVPDFSDRKILVYGPKEMVSDLSDLK